MTILMNLIFSFVIDLIAWIIKKLAFKLSFIAILRVFQGIFFAIAVAAFVAFLSLINKVYTILHSFIIDYNNFHVSAVAGPNDFGSIFLGLLDSTGIGLAFATTINLYILVFLLLLTKFLYEKYIFIQEIIYRFVNDIVQVSVK
ncbi:MAG: hypothetical protein PHE73_03785 [Sulfurovaceae bacterium]|nr:hypothetical protein [Sulfurovaceae bacterium]